MTDPKFIVIMITFIDTIYSRIGLSLCGLPLLLTVKH